MDIREALGTLDTFDDNLWTSEGLPRLDALKDLLGRTVTRQEVTDAAPKFTRSNTDLSMIEDQPSPLSEAQAPPADPLDLEDYSSILASFHEASPMSVKDFTAFLSTVPVGALESLLGLIFNQQQAVIQKRNELEEMDRNLKTFKLFTETRLQREVPDMSDQAAIMAFIKSQTEQRAQKKQVMNDIFKGIDLSKFDPRAPIDRAMARKTARGTQRPIHPMR